MRDYGAIRTSLAAVHRDRDPLDGHRCPNPACLGTLERIDGRLVCGVCG